MLCIYPIVEGHGEVEAVRTLLSRVWAEIVHRNDVRVLRPQRMPKSKLLKATELTRAVELGRRKLLACETEERLVLILFDADSDLPCAIAPRMRQELGDCGIDVSIVVANPEYETWFVGAAESLSTYLIDTGAAPQEPERTRTRKRWIDEHIRTGTYSETIDQPKLTARMNLHSCRSRCPSFDKLCRELEARNR